MRPLEGEIVSVNTSHKHGFPKEPQRVGILDELGILGDAHYGEWRESFRQPGTIKANDRPISLVAVEILELLNQQLGLAMKPGDFNEQFLVQGLGDLGNIAIGAILRIYSQSVGTVIELEVTDYAYPCEKLAQHVGDSRIIKFLVDNSRKNSKGDPYSKRGILARVRKGGVVRPGQVIAVEVDEN